MRCFMNKITDNLADQTLVSVCMATYNGGKYIREQVDSILNQEFKENQNVELELVVSDDGSTDDTLQILEAYHDPRIKIFNHQNKKKYKYFNANRLASDNFGNALLNAHGDYLFFSDQDDVWMPSKLDKSLTILREYGGGIGAAFYVGDENLHHIGEVIYNHHAPFFSLKDQIGIYGFSMGFCKQELKYILPLPSFVAGHDKYIQYSLKWRNKLHFIDEPCAIHRWTGTHNVSSFTHNNSQPPFFVKCLFRLNTYLSVIWRSIVR